MTIAEKIEIAKNIVKENTGKFITIDFIKKDGTLRHMMCHKSKVLESQITGNKPEVTAKRKETMKLRGMIHVEELTSDKTYQHRIVNLSTVKRIAAGGKVYEFDGEEA